MPTEQQWHDAVSYALTQHYKDDFGNTIQITRNTEHYLVYFVREYFNQNDIVYSNFSYDDLLPYLN